MHSTHMHMKIFVIREAEASEQDVQAQGETKSDLPVVAVTDVIYAQVFYVQTVAVNVWAATVFRVAEKG